MPSPPVQDMPRGMGLTWSRRPLPRDVADPKLYRAAQGFEAYFARYLFNELSASTPMFDSKAPGGEIYQGFFSDAIGEEIAAGGSLGIAEMIYRQMTEKRGVEAGVPGGDGIRMGADTRLNEYRAVIDRAASRHNLDPDLLRAVIKRESGGDPNAVSPSGAKGLMRLTPSRVRAYSVGNPFDPGENVDAGAAVLRDLMDRFENLDLALAAYHAGPEAVKRYDNSVPPFRETRTYLNDVKRFLAEYRGKASGTKPRSLTE
ncbi:MAG TPA: hypothetical protein ENI92_06115 [Bacteroidetes bacterium]|nr:hypothetical protein [Bacteroidota bacterium]